MEFRLINPVESEFVKEIRFNSEELKSELAARMEQYKNLVYTEETIKQGKVDRANLNKFKDALETKRKEIKSMCLSPYNEFEKKVKELISLIDEPISLIDIQLKSFEQSKKNIKQAEILAFYNKNIGDLKELLPFEKLFKTQYLNTTFSMNSIKAEISATIENTREDLKFIETFETEFLLQVKDKYIQTLDLGLALKEKNRLEEQKVKLEEYQKQQNVKQTQEPIFKKENIEEEELVMKVWVNSEQKYALNKFMESNGIRYAIKK